MAKLPDDGSSKIPDHIEQIREIIFGAQKRDYDQRFAKIIADLDRYKEDTRTKAEEMEGSLKADIEARHRSLEQEIHQLAQKIQEELADTKSKLRSEARVLREQLSSEIESQVSALRDSNVSREAMAELLQELAMKLKGIEVLEELTKAARKTPRE